VSEGRFVLGLGIGDREGEFATMGVAYPPGGSGRLPRRLRRSVACGGTRLVAWVVGPRRQHGQCEVPCEIEIARVQLRVVPAGFGHARLQVVRVLWPT